jgi:hypothetical protein
MHSTPAVNPVDESLKGSTESTVSLSGEQGEPGARVQRFITEQLASGHTPTLKEIVDACQCSKNTAIRHRRTLIGNGDERARAHPTLTVVKAL